MSNGLPYVVVEGPTFLKRAGRLTGSVKAWDEIKEFFDLYVARNPDIGKLVPGTNVYAMPLETNPPLTIYYTVDNDSETVTLVDLAKV